MIAQTCPSCQEKLSIKDELAGKKIKCPACQSVVMVPQTEAATMGKQADNFFEERTVPPRQNPDAEERTLPPSKRNDAEKESLSSSGDQTQGVDGKQGTQAYSGEPSRELTDFLSPPQAADELGRLGPFRVLKVLGAGGMGVVYKAEDPQLKRLVALKAMLPTLGASESARKRFMREAQSAAAVVHDHIVPIHQVGEDRGIPFVAMQFLEGEPLDERLKRENGLAMGEVVRIGRETAEGLAAAHDKGLIHRDIKPANIWLEGKKARVKILDFGLARAAADDSHLTQTGAILGTPAYMAPEQAAGDKVNSRCDLFSLGCVLYRMCTGQIPFRGKDSISTLIAVATEDPDSPAKINPDVPAKLSDLVMKLLAKKPEERPSSAHAVVEALQEIDVRTIEIPARTGIKAQPQRGKEATKTQFEPAPKKAPVPGKKRIPMSWLIGGGVLGLVILLAGIILFWRTSHGLVKIESDDPNVEIVFMKDGPTIKGVGKEPISIRSGEYSLLVKRGDFKFETNKLFIGSGKTVTLKVELLQGKVRVSADGHVIAAEEPILAKTFKNSLGMEFVLVPKGKSWLGGGGGKPGTKEVAILHDFYLGKYEVTRAEWEKVTGVNPSEFKAVAGVAKEDQKRLPVENVSWENCQVFVKGLNDQAKEAGWVYRLPKEMEWEYACRGGPMLDKLESAFNYYLEKPTNTLLPDQANFGNKLKRPCKVGSYKPNRLGLYDMHGNVSEWCQDELKDDKGASRRATRGGSWAGVAGYCQAAPRYKYPPSSRRGNVGLRLVRVPVGKEIVKVLSSEAPPQATGPKLSVLPLKPGKILADDDFSDPAKSLFAATKKDDPNPIRREFAHGRYLFRFGPVKEVGLNWVGWGTSARYGDFIYQATGQVTGGQKGFWGAYLAGTPEGSGLRVMVRGDGQVVVDPLPWKKDFPVPKVGPFPPPANYQPETFHDLALVRTGDQVTIYLDGKQVAAPIALEKPWGATGCGLIGIQGGLEEIRAEFKRYTVWEPGTGFTNGLGMEFVLVPKGKSWLGGGGGKPGTKQVEIAHDFYLGKYEVTQEEWQKVMRNNTNWFGRFGQGKDIVKNISDDELKRFPVESISWFDAQRFVEELNKLTKETGWVYRLPSEVEWEYACRGGPMKDKAESAFDFYLERSANQLLQGQANVKDGKGLKRTCKVGSYKPNRLGLYDMHGNVWESCQNEWKDDKGAQKRVYRGGSWDNDGVASRAAFRDTNPPMFQTHNLGLRLARVPVGKQLVVAPP